MNDLPKSIVRLDDGAEFILDEENETYYLKSAQNIKNKGHFIFQYTVEQLLKLKGFKVKDDTMDLEAMKQDWLEKIRSNNDGHGNGDFD